MLSLGFGDLSDVMFVRSFFNYMFRSQGVRVMRSQGFSV